MLEIIFVIILLLGIVYIWLDALIDCLKRPELQLNGSRTTWMLAIIFTGIIGAILYDRYAIKQEYRPKDEDEEPIRIKIF